ncbi:putative 2OG-Fe(II) oxygenase [Candidatus Pelagibacter sp.]|uniref:putative 2OG-Fe(II) oxygenase n=1 Tax=Candidatus Pelagibacter sp. TaxID=2024849 RepID=UPI003F85778F
MQEIKILKPFSPTVVKVKIPKNIIYELNDYVDQVIENNKKSKDLDHGKNLVGDVTQELKLEKEIMEKTGWANFLASCTSKWIQIEFRKKLTKFIIKDSWVVRQFKNEYNPTHWHDGHLSGAGFLKIPKEMGKHTQSQKEGYKDYKGGYLQLLHGAKMFACDSKMTIKPEVGDFYIFPHYLMHSVFPFKGTDEERRSISFNALIDENIYDVYGN